MKVPFTSFHHAFNMAWLFHDPEAGHISIFARGLRRVLPSIPKGSLGVPKPRLVF